MRPIDVEEYRRPNGEINLHEMVAAAQDCPLTFLQREFLDDLGSIRKVASRQLAALIVTILVRMD